MAAKMKVPSGDTPEAKPAAKPVKKPTVRTTTGEVVNGTVIRLKAWPKSVKPET